MKSEVLIKIFKRDVIEGNLKLYQNLLETTTEAKVFYQYIERFFERRKGDFFKILNKMF